MTNPTNWNATAFFENLTQSNRLATDKNFVFCRVSGLEGFEEALGEMQTANNFVCVSDIADGYTELNNTPRTRRVKTVFFAMRHAIDDMAARADCFDVMQELFRQFMSVLILQRVKLEEQCIYIDPRITVNEIDRYFFSGCACAYFQVAVDKYTDLRYNADEWKNHYAEVGDDEYDYSLRYRLYLNNQGNDPVHLIMAIRNFLNIGLKEAKAVSDEIPTALFVKISGDEDQARLDTFIGKLDEYEVNYMLKRL